MSAAAATELAGTAVDAGTDLIEHYYELGYSDGLPLVPPTAAKISAVIDRLGGGARQMLCRVPPR